ncbi:hypothetical protein FRC06_005242 [Ceratobasidium sp. 370]|nr:hypothetical protein FRC06_005242 [Ceratobasidium sp. 370]
MPCLNTPQTTLCLLTSVPAIAVRHIVVTVGHFQVNVQCRKHFLFVDNALSSSGMLALRVVKGSFTAETYRDFIELTLAFMNPYPGPNSVLVMDNARIHHNQETLDMIEAHGMRYLFLPPYSPDYNPIELAFSAIKNRMRRDGEMIRMTLQAGGDEDEVRAKFYEHVFATTEEDARGWFEYCGYA